MEQKKRHLVIQHAEMMDAKLFESYQQVLRQFIKGRHGVYALYKGQRLYYVGLASNLRSRVRHHLKDRHQGKWNRFSLFITTTHDHLRELEALVLRIAKPKGNRSTTRFAGSADIKKQIRRMLAQAQKAELDALMGMESDDVEAPATAKKRRRERDSSSRSAAGLVERGTRIWMVYRGKDYYARLHPSGRISYGGTLYDSPSGAGSAIRKKATNGWSWWWIHRRGEWVRLKELR